jgi:hypothetical protein
MPRPFDMRRPENVPPKQKTVHVPPEVILGIVNQTDKAAHARVSKTVQDRFAEIAGEVGWKGVHFAKDAQTQHSAAAILLNPYSDLPLPENKSPTTLRLK